MTRCLFCSAAMIAVLSSCAGGDSVVSPTYLSPAPAGSFNAFVNDETRFLNRYYGLDFKLKQTSDADIPRSGTATYRGTAAFSQGSRETSFKSNGSNLAVSRTPPDITGRATLTADFGTAKVSGRIEDFKSADNSDLPGQVTLNAADITGSSYASGTVSGSFPVDGTATNVTMGGHSGQFVGTDATGIYGNVTLILPIAGAPFNSISGTITAENASDSGR